jgi:hypothetical protein
METVQVKLNKTLAERERERERERGCARGLKARTL